MKHRRVHPISSRGLVHALNTAQVDESHDSLFDDEEILRDIFGIQPMESQPITPERSDAPVVQSSLYAIYVLQALGDLVVTSQIARQLKHTEPDCRVVWFVLKKNAFVLRGNPYIDEIVELEGNNKDWDAKIDELK